jgi:hypothetical protein
MKLFSAAHSNLSKIYHISAYKASLNKYKKAEIILSDHNGIKLENDKRNYRKYPNPWTWNNALLNDQNIIEEIKG